MYAGITYLVWGFYFFKKPRKSWNCKHNNKQMKSINKSNIFSGFKDLILAAVSLPDIFNCYLRALK